MNTRRMVSLGLLILVMVISGCAGNVSTEKTKTLTLWYWNRSLDDELIKSVEKEFPGSESMRKKSVATSNRS
ncbi:hypothetical protein [Paenibacillus lautus]|uniref:hypothetical protein n=1 Tax=Paenibacillus lautus TaxID=1401 RepID=UPI001FE27ADD|nr:hypothetical protein [Paenibacillus lautus]